MRREGVRSQRQVLPESGDHIQLPQSRADAMPAELTTRGAPSGVRLLQHTSYRGWSRSLAKREAVRKVARQVARPKDYMCPATAALVEQG